MVANHIVLVITLSTWTLSNNPCPVHVVVIHNAEVNLESRTLNIGSKIFSMDNTSPCGIHAPPSCWIARLMPLCRDVKESSYNIRSFLSNDSPDGT